MSYTITKIIYEKECKNNRYNVILKLNNIITAFGFMDFVPKVNDIIECKLEKREVKYEYNFKKYELLHTDFKFFGAVPCDYDISFININDLLKNCKTKFGIIYNTDDSNGPGQHWVAIYGNITNKEIYYYNSTGDKPQSEF